MGIGPSHGGMGLDKQFDGYDSFDYLDEDDVTPLDLAGSSSGRSH